MEEIADINNISKIKVYSGTVRDQLEKWGFSRKQINNMLRVHELHQAGGFNLLKEC